MSEPTMCCAKVRVSGAIRSYYHDCKRKASVTIDGKPYCGTHNPQARKARQDARNDKRQRQWDESKKRARLHAAAPVLLEACERLIGSLGVMVLDPNSDGDIVFARAAIAKARGESWPEDVE